MKKQTNRFLAAKAVLSLAIVATFGLGASTALAGIPVIDGTNLSQNTVTAVEQVAAYAQQVQQYESQLQQYANMLQNTGQLPQQIWDQAVNTMNNLQTSMQGLAYFQQQAGSVQSYLNKFGNTQTVSTQNCFNGVACSQADIQAIQANQAQGNAGVKASADSMLSTLQTQQSNMTADAQTLKTLQSGAQSADGQKAALDAANQLASAQANQLLQIRALLVAQQTAEGAKLEADNALDAQTKAATTQFTSGSYTNTTPEQTW
jgi:P-type conjugative transfer protein TrbJ